MTRLRRAIWAAGAPVRTALIGAIRVYRVTLSGWLGGQCRFYPSCSHYAEDAIRLRGATVGSALAIWRILRCNPFGKGGVDRVEGSGHPPYDDLLHDDRPAIPPGGATV